ncbi:hypothetical protein Ddye_000022 [Dipteronia dyeriana]|uniref:Reverse transcriptase domain-containing protein n=1 Tax=Dipteronia dyeriana TaxID=168575 RepID=A0AAD9XM58_9ROSI|nr:hypothetical protein Ddye_000022 [Dipteronia dyeriana]
MSVVVAKDDRCAKVLGRWNYAHPQDLNRQIKKKKDELAVASNVNGISSWKTVRKIESQLDRLLETEEDYWRQRSRQDWLKAGDYNSKFFHWKASSRRARNKIVGVEDSNGAWCDSHADVQRIVLDYFSDLFKSSNPTSQYWGKAVFKMSPSKSPGIDGMPALFYQKNWDTVGDGVTKACLRCLNNGEPLDKVNKTLITLIPKTSNGSRIMNFRPISLCSVLYKIIAKSIANRLRLVIGDVISENQSAFVPGRLITDNAIIGFECIHGIRTRNRKAGSVALKLDMSKAYDHVEWGFISSMMLKLGFRLAGWLSCLIHRDVSHSDIYRYRCGSTGPFISHLFVADDNLLFAKANDNNCRAIKHILDDYALASGQEVNFGKSAICTRKEVLVKAVIQALPSYAMNLFKLPKGLISDFRRFCSRFWWGSTDTDRKIHWGSWVKLCDRRCPCGSFVWKRFLLGRELFQKGYRWRIANQSSISIYRDRWVPRPHSFMIQSPPILGENALVKRLITPSGSWDVPLIRFSFSREEGDAILSIPIRQQAGDSIIWHFGTDGNYKIKVPPKVKSFLWKACKKWLPTAFNLAGCGVPTEMLCLGCSKRPETTSHALWCCQTLKGIRLSCSFTAGPKWRDDL